MSITLSEQAAAAVIKIIEDEDLAGQYLRVKVLGGGCAGFEYDLYLEDGSPGDFDEVFEDKEIKIVCDQLSLQYMEGCIIDYEDRGLLGAGFKFVNPNVTNACACGNSVSFGG